MNSLRTSCVSFMHVTRGNAKSVTCTRLLSSYQYSLLLLVLLMYQIISSVHKLGVPRYPKQPASSDYRNHFTMGFLWRKCRATEPRHQQTACTQMLQCTVFTRMLRGLAIPNSHSHVDCVPFIQLCNWLLWLLSIVTMVTALQ
jgi:hypothetical protein